MSCSSCGEAQRKARGHDGPPGQPMELDGEQLGLCPLRPYYDDPSGFMVLFERYRLARDGMLCDPGLMPDQAHPFVLYYRVIQRAVDDAEATLRRKREAEQRKAERSARTRARRGRRR